jgi:hypothetical protein
MPFGLRPISVASWHSPRSAAGGRLRHAWLHQLSQILLLTGHDSQELTHLLTIEGVALWISFSLSEGTRRCPLSP